MRTFMWNNIRKPLFAMSLGLNLAFIAIWLVHLASMPSSSGGISSSTTDKTIPSALHREIGVTEEQWKRIEPLVQDFREKAGKQRQKISALRGQLMNLLTMSEVDKTSIQLKQDEIFLNQQQMQNLVIDHLLKEKEILSPDQGKTLMNYLREQSCQDKGTGSRMGIGRILDRKTSVAPDKD